MAVSKRLRYEVLRRDNHTCRYCGAEAPGVKMTVDHVVPQALGGSDDPTNLVAACEPCNSGKTSIPADAPIVADVEKDALRWAAAMDKSAELARAKFEARLNYRNAFREAWVEWKAGPEHAQKPIALDANWESSLDNFYEAGLPDWELSEAVRAAMTNQKVIPANTFRYFAGICWTKIRQLQTQAREIVDTDQVRIMRTVDDETINEITERWLTAFRARCKEKAIDDTVRIAPVTKTVTALLQQGYPEDQVRGAAEKAGARLTVHLPDFLGESSWGDFTYDAMTQWVLGWNEADLNSPRWRSSVPSVSAWSDLRIEVQGAISAGLPGDEILSACRKAGELHEGTLIALPDWEGRWERVMPGCGL